MSEQKHPAPQDEPQTTRLNMGKFVPRKPEDPPSTLGEDSPTVVIRHAAANVAHNSPQPVVAPKGGGNALPPTEMLGAVSYAYAKGVYRSEDIERKLEQDPAVREALGHEIPDAKTIRKFRRQNRDAISATLEKFFRWARRKPAEQPPSAPAPQTPPAAKTSTDDSSVFIAKKAAAARLDEAAFVDNMSKED